METTLSVTVLFHNLLPSDLDPKASWSRAHCVDACFYNRTCASVFYDSLLALCYQSDLWFEDTVKNLVAREGVSHIAFNRSDCPSQWIYHKPSSKCFRLNTISRPYNVATNECEAEGGRLFNIYSAMEDRLVITHVIRAGIGIWFGLRKVDGVFQWHKGTSLCYTNWYSTSSGSCVLVHNVYREWFKYGCSNQRPSLCERVLHKQNLCAI